jgi:hypothetical protein
MCVSIDGTHCNEKALQITTHLGIARISGSKRLINIFKGRNNTVCRTLSGGKISNYYKKLKLITSGM